MDSSKNQKQVYTGDIVQEVYSLTDEIMMLQFRFAYDYGITIPMVEHFLDTCYAENKCETCPRHIVGNTNPPPFKKCGHNFAVINRKERNDKTVN